MRGVVSDERCGVMYQMRCVVVPDERCGVMC